MALVDHHHLRHHSLVLEYVEAQAVSHQLVMDVEATLTVYKADLAYLEADEIQEAPEVVDLVAKGNFQDHQRKSRLAEMDNWYYLLLRSQV